MVSIRLRFLKEILVNAKYLMRILYSPSSCFVLFSFLENAEKIKTQFEKRYVTSVLTSDVIFYLNLVGT